MPCLRNPIQIYIFILVGFDLGDFRFNQPHTFSSGQAGDSLVASKPECTTWLHPEELAHGVAFL